MKRSRFVIFALSIALAIGRKANAEDPAPLKLVATIPLPGLHDGDFDHFAPDVDGHRLFLTAEENNKFLVLDTSTNQLVHTLDNVEAPHSLLFRKDLKKIFIVAGDASAVQIYDSDNFKLTGEIKVSIDADSIAYDRANHQLYVVNGGREAHTPYSLISVIDTDASKKLRDIKIDADHVEAIVPEEFGSRMFCNLTGKSAVGVLDRKRAALIDTWMLPADAQANVAMAFDEPNHRLFVATRKPGKLIVLNSDDGKVVSSLPAVGMVDDMSFDLKYKRLYLAGDGALDVFQQKDPDHYALLAKIPGAFRAKTGILVPELNRYYLAVPHHENKDAEVRVYEIEP